MSKTNKRFNVLILTISFIICLSMLTACGSTDGNQNEDIQETSVVDSNETESNETYEEPDSLGAEDFSGTDTYFNEVRATINMDRNEILAMLTDVIEETEDGPERENAIKQKLKIYEYIEKEIEIESLIIDEGFPNALVLMTDSYVNVTVSKQELTQEETDDICDIVTRATGRPAEKIVIQSKF